jgi:hypothetical protein
MSVLDALDDGIAALTYLRRQAAQGRVDEGVLEALLRSGLLDHELIQAALSALDQGGAGEAVGGSSGHLPPSELRSDGDDSGDATNADQAEPAGSEGSGETAADGGDTAGGDASDEPEPESPYREAEALVSQFVAMPAALDKLGVSVPEKALSFCKGAGRIAQGLPADEKKGDALAALLFKGMGVLDLIEHELIWSGFREPLQSALNGLRGPTAALLARDNGLTFTPPVDLHSIDPDDPPSGAAIEWVPGPQAAGTVLAVPSRAYNKDGAEGGKAQLIVARGTPGVVRTLLLSVWQGVEADSGTSPLADLAKLSRWIGELNEDDEASQVSTARHVLNLLHDRNASGEHNALEKQLIAYLGKSGITVLTAKIGKRFDESFKPSKYDRQLVYSDQPEGTIVRIVRIGLLDSGGIPLQKAVLGVSRGS